jgi:hypothetical protein
MTRAKAATATRERPILFSGPMVRAILDGTKTQTRRVITNLNPTFVAANPTAAHVQNAVPCPYGAPGDRLWVRETWGSVQMHEIGQHFYGGPRIPDRTQAVYRAGKQMGIPVDGTSPLQFRTEWRDDLTPERWRSSIHMPRWASRLTLVIESVRVQRVQEITEDDARAEGVECQCDTGQSEYDGCALSTVDHYANLWDSLNASRGYSWGSDCWVWALTFSVSASNAAPPGSGAHPG